MDTITNLGEEPLHDLPSVDWRILPLHAISETHGLAGLRHHLALEIADLDPDDVTAAAIRRDQHSHSTTSACRYQYEPAGEPPTGHNT